jgi:hypothetical protein
MRYEDKGLRTGDIKRRGKHLGKAPLSDDEMRRWCEAYPDREWRQATDTVIAEVMYESNFVLLSQCILGNGEVRAILEATRGK